MSNLTWCVNKIWVGVVSYMENDDGDWMRIPFSKRPLQGPKSIFDIISDCNIDFLRFSSHRLPQARIQSTQLYIESTKFRGHSTP